MRVFIFLADGFEDMEALATRDVLLRGGVEVLTVSLTDRPQVESSHSVMVLSDRTWPDFLSHVAMDAEDVMVFPGGMPGSRNLAEKADLIALMQRHYAAGGCLAAICAAPGLVLSQLDSWQGKHFTCFEGFQDALLEKGGIFTREPAVTDGQLITGRGAGHAVSFGLEILRAVKGSEAVARVKEGLML